MMKFFQVLVATCFVTTLMTGCGVNPKNLRKPIEQSSIELKEPMVFLLSACPICGETKIATGLISGKYTSEFEDDDGVYYRGPSFCKIQSLGYYFEGGIWISKSSNADPKFKIYRYMKSIVSPKGALDRNYPFITDSVIANGDSSARTSPDQKINDVSGHRMKKIVTDIVNDHALAVASAASSVKNINRADNMAADSVVTNQAIQATPATASPVQAGVVAGVATGLTLGLVELIAEAEKDNIIFDDIPPEIDVNKYIRQAR